MIAKTPCHETALDTFCRSHWLRLHGLACHLGCGSQDAEDAVQESFLNLARGGFFDDLLLQSEEAQMSYLSMKLRCLIFNRWRDAHRQRRGGPLPVLSLDEEGVPEPPCYETPATHHDRVWLAGCITTAISRLRLQTRAQVWRQISPALFEELETTQTGAQRVALHRARKKLRGLVREEMNGSFNEWHVGAV